MNRARIASVMMFLAVTTTASVAFAQTQPPVGSIIAWHRDLPGVPSLPGTGEWVECNGQTLSDAASPLDGEVIPDLNDSANQGAAGYYLRGSADVSGATQAAQVGGHTHTINHGHSIKTNGLIPQSVTRATTTTGTFTSVSGVVNDFAGSSGDNNPGAENRVKTFKIAWIMRVK